MVLNIFTIIGLIFGEILAIYTLFNPLKLNKSVIIITSILSFVGSTTLFYFSLEEFFIPIFSLSFGTILAIKALLLRSSAIQHLLASFFFFAFVILYFDNDLLYVLSITYLSIITLIILLGKLFVPYLELDRKKTNPIMFIVKIVTISIFVAALILLALNSTYVQEFRNEFIFLSLSIEDYVIFDTIQLTGTTLIIALTILSSFGTEKRVNFTERMTIE